MAIKGSVAKIEVAKKIEEIFGSDFIMNDGGKLYVYANDGDNGKVQICISMTCPKNQVNSSAAAPISTGRDFTHMDKTQPARDETPDEKANIEELMKRLGL